jgi:hypothetical protein
VGPAHAALIVQPTARRIDSRAHILSTSLTGSPTGSPDHDFPLFTRLVRRFAAGVRGERRGIQSGASDLGQARTEAATTRVKQRPTLVATTQIASAVCASKTRKQARRVQKLVRMRLGYGRCSRGVGVRQGLPCCGRLRGRRGRCSGSASRPGAAGLRGSASSTRAWGCRKLGSACRSARRQDRRVAI